MEDTEAFEVWEQLTLKVFEAEAVTVCVLLSLPDGLALGDPDSVAVPEPLAVSL